MGLDPPASPEATPEISANPVTNTLRGRWLRECPVKVILGTHFMHVAYKSEENLQNDRHMTPKCTI